MAKDISTAWPPIGRQEAHIQRSARPLEARKFPRLSGIREKESRPRVENITNRMLKGSDWWVKWGTIESTNPKPAAVPSARKMPTKEEGIPLVGHPIKATAVAASPAAAQVSKPIGLGDRPSRKRNKATKTDLEPMMGVTIDASLERRAAKQRD